MRKLSLPHFRRVKRKPDYTQTMTYWLEMQRHQELHAAYLSLFDAKLWNRENMTKHSKP